MAQLLIEAATLIKIADLNSASCHLLLLMSSQIGTLLLALVFLEWMLLFSLRFLFFHLESCQLDYHINLLKEPLTRLLVPSLELSLISLLCIIK